MCFFFIFISEDSLLKKLKRHEYFNKFNRKYYSVILGVGGVAVDEVELLNPELRF